LELNVLFQNKAKLVGGIELTKKISKLKFLKAGICQEFKLLSQSMQSLMLGEQFISPQSSHLGWDSVA